MKACRTDFGIVLVLDDIYQYSCSSILSCVPTVSVQSRVFIDLVNSMNVFCIRKSSGQVVSSIYFKRSRCFLS